jgi:hypothetical protein
MVSVQVIAELVVEVEERNQLQASLAEVAAYIQTCRWNYLNR